MMYQFNDLAMKKTRKPSHRTARFVMPMYPMVSAIPQLNHQFSPNYQLFQHQNSYQIQEQQYNQVPQYQMPPDQLTNLSPNKTPKSFVQSDESNSDFSNRENAESHYNNFNSNFCIVNKIENIHPNGEIRFSQNAEISGINPIQLLTFSEGDVPGCFDIVRRSSH